MTRIATIQMVSTADVSNNLEAAATLIQQAVAEHAEFLLLPENFPLMGREEHDKVGVLEPFGKGPIQTFLSDQARQHGIWLLGGTIPLKARHPNRIRAASLLFNPAGQCVSRYDKIHLFDVTVNDSGEEAYNESGTIEAGDEIVVARTPFANIGLSVCYDLRFPELYRSMHEYEVNMITVPSAFTATTGAVHWEPLLRARAVENLCYVVASNQGGEHVNGRKTWGHSMIINPWGEVLTMLGQGEGVACADINPEQLKQLRDRFPALKHRKLDYHSRI